ncbi:unnamed protein product [Bubo scandiacus]
MAGAAAASFPLPSPCGRVVRERARLPTGGGKGRDKHRVRKDPQGKRERQEERRKSGQQAEEREGRSGQSAAVRSGAAT